MHIVFVCTGNTCRSPMAEALLKDKTNAHTVSSCGLSVPFPAPAAENAVRVMAEKGIDISDHRATQLTADTVEKAELILTMTEGHRKILTTLFPSAKEKTHTLSEFAGENGDIADPFGGDIETYRLCAAQIAHLLEVAPL